MEWKNVGEGKIGEQPQVIVGGKYYIYDYTSFIYIERYSIAYD